MKKIIAGLVLAAAVIAAGAGHSVAASITYRGVSLTPAVQQLTLNQGQSSLSYRIRLDNNQSSPLTLVVSSLDFKSLNESGGLAFITSDNANDHKYGLANWISPSSPNITLPAGGGQFVDIRVDNRADLSPGGHYAAILFKIVSPGLSASTNKVEVDQVISSLLFVRKTGGEIYGLSLKRVNLHRSWFGWPTGVDMLFANTGNVQSAPRGYVSLGGSSGVINPSSSLVLPGSDRLISSPIKISRKPIWPRFYSAHIAYRADGQSKFSYDNVRFFYFNWPFWLFVAALVGYFAYYYAPIRRLFKWPLKGLAWLGAVLSRFSKRPR